MKRRLSPGLLGCLLAVLAVLAASACGSEAQSEAQDPATVWVDKACASLVQLQDQRTRQPQINRTDLAGAKDALSSFYADAVAAADRGLADLAAAGPSPLPDGADVAARFRTLLEQVRAAAAAAKAKIDTTDPRDPKQFEAALSEMAAALQAHLQRASAVITELNANQDFNRAAAAAPRCKPLQSPATSMSPSP